MESKDDKMLIRHYISYEFHHRKSAAQAYTSIYSVLGNEVLSKRTCELWFRRFLEGNFDVCDLERNWIISKVNSVGLQALLDTDSLQPFEYVNKLFQNDYVLWEKFKQKERGRRIN